MKFDVETDSGSVSVNDGTVRLEATEFRRLSKSRVADVRLFVGEKIAYSNTLELASAAARAAFAAAALAELVSANGSVGVDLVHLLLALDEAVHRDAVSRRGKGPSTARPRLDATDLDLARIAERTWRVIKDANDPPFLFAVGGVPSRIETGTGAAVIRPLTPDRLRHHLGRLVDWRQEGDRPALPPLHVVRDLLAHPDPPLPPLERVVGAPVFADDGSLLTTPGYHRAARIYYEPLGLVVSPIPETPTDEDVRHAVATLREPISEFPFTGDAEIAHAYAFALLPFTRALIDGPTPLHLFEKPAPRTGASLLVSALALPALGRPVAVMTAARDDDEWRKRITAKLIGGPAVILIDNVRARLDSEHLSAVLTAWPDWEDRPMGLSEMRRIPNLAAWAATANNAAVSNELAGRIARVRLDAKTDRPYERTGYRIPDLLVWVAQHRGALVRAALTLVRAWLARGRPAGAATAILPGFERWSFVIGGILAVAQIRGFLENMREVYDLSDAEGAENRRLLGLWFERFGEAEVGVAELFPLADEAELPLAGRTERALKTSLGARLTKLRDRRYAIESLDGIIEVYLQTAGKQHGAARWRLARATGAGKGPSRFVGSPPEMPKTAESPPPAGEPGNLGEPFAAPGGAPERSTDDDPTDPPEEARR